MKLTKFSAFAALALMSFPMAGCVSQGAGTATQTVVSAATIGSDLVTIGSGVQLASLLYATADKPDPTILNDMGTAANALIACGNDLRTTGATSGDITADISLAKAAINAAIAGYASVDPTKAAKLQAYADTFNAALVLFDSDLAASSVQAAISTAVPAAASTAVPAPVPAPAAAAPVPAPVAAPT